MIYFFIFLLTFKIYSNIMTNDKYLKTVNTPISDFFIPKQNYFYVGDVANTIPIYREYLQISFFRYLSMPDTIQNCLLYNLIIKKNNFYESKK